MRIKKNEDIGRKIHRKVVMLKNKREFGGLKCKECGEDTKYHHNYCKEHYHSRKGTDKKDYTKSEDK